MLGVVKISRSHRERKVMPQIDDVAELEAWLRQQGIHYHTAVVSPQHLHATQNEVDLDLVFALISAGLDFVTHPLIASYDMYVIDGHHRMEAALVDHVVVRVIVIHENLRSLLPKLQAEFNKRSIINEEEQDVVQS